MTLYTDLLAAGCEMGNHESDLHVKCTPEAAKIINLHQPVIKCRDPLRGPARFHARQKLSRKSERGTLKGIIHGTFESNIDGCLWWDIPFAFDPFWKRL